jgi:glyoxylase-like metal-dependent hydrolase (beta-lactamase superfamily II)
MAEQMRNFVYLIGDREAGEALVVDPAWAVQEIVDLAAADDLRITGALVTHYHPDHIGGDLFGTRVDGLADLMRIHPCPVHVHKVERDGVRVVTGLEASDLVPHESGDTVAAGGVSVELLHTPGHTPGSLCFRVQGSLVAGDTLFLQGCGRVDLPGGDAEELFRSLRKIDGLPSETIVFPGHDYGGPKGRLDELRQSNMYLRVQDMKSWRRLFGLGGR